MLYLITKELNYSLETWNDIEGYDGLYQVSSWGRVKNSRSGKECAKQLGLHRGNITQVLKGKRKTCGGYTFKYKEVI